MKKKIAQKIRETDRPHGRQCAERTGGLHLLRNRAAGIHGHGRRGVLPSEGE